MKTQMYLGCLFSSPIGAFIFLMERYIGYDSIGSAFSSPIGAFIFLMLHHPATNIQELKIFVPYRGFYFLNPGLAILVFMRVKKMFCGVNLF